MLVRIVLLSVSWSKQTQSHCAKHWPLIASICSVMSLCHSGLQCDFIVMHKFKAFVCSKVSSISHFCAALLFESSIGLKVAHCGSTRHEKFLCQLHTFHCSCEQQWSWTSCLQLIAMQQPFECAVKWNNPLMPEFLHSNCQMQQHTDFLCQKWWEKAAKWFVCCEWSIIDCKKGAKSMVCPVISEMFSLNEAQNAVVGNALHFLSRRWKWKDNIVVLSQMLAVTDETVSTKSIWKKPVFKWCDSISFDFHIDDVRISQSHNFCHPFHVKCHKASISLPLFSVCCFLCAQIAHPRILIWQLNVCSLHSVHWWHLPGFGEWLTSIRQTGCCPISVALGGWHTVDDKTARPPHHQRNCHSSPLKFSSLNSRCNNETNP